MDLKNFYNHINMCLNAVTRLREDLFSVYQSIKRQYDFAEYFIIDRDNPSYYRHLQLYISLGRSLLVSMTNDTCVKYSMSSQSYKVVNTHAHEISGYTIISIIPHSRAPHLGGMNSDVKSDIATMEFNNGEKLKTFIAGFSDSNKKLCSLDNFSLLQEFYYST